MNTGKRIKKIRKELGLTQKELEKKLNVSEAMISQYEAKKELKLGTIQKIANALGVNYLELLGEETQEIDKNVYFEKGDLLVKIEKDSNGNIKDIELCIFKKYNPAHTHGIVYFELGDSSVCILLENLYPVSNKDKFLLGAKI